MQALLQTLPESFEHSPLPDASTHIRLLLPNRNSTAHTPSFIVQVCSLSDAPPFAAVSYTWGAPNTGYLIELNGQNYAVRENCHSALEYLFKHCRSDHIWIDSVCIDQTDMDEKPAQVSLMGQVYRQAAEVYAFVGAEADDSHFLFEQVHLETALNGHRTSLSVSESLSGRGKAYYERLAMALTCFTRRPYFTRLWIVQELLLAAEVYVACGNDIESLRNFMIFRLGVRQLAWTKDLQCLINCEQKEFASLLKDLSDRHCETTSTEGAALVPVQQQRSQGLLYDTLGRYGKHECSEALDRVYALLGVVHWLSHIPPVQPKYSDSRLDIAILLLAHCIQPLLNEAVRIAELLIERLKITADDKDVQRVVSRRQVHMSAKGVIPNEAPSYAAALEKRHVAQMCESLREIHQCIDGDLTINDRLEPGYDDSFEQLPEPEARDEGPSYRRVFGGGKCIGIVPATVMAGDCLVRQDFWDIVLRKTKDGYVLVAQAFLHRGRRSAIKSPCVCGREPRRVLDSNHYLLIIWDLEDLLMLAIQRNKFPHTTVIGEWQWRSLFSLTELCDRMNYPILRAKHSSVVTVEELRSKDASS